MLFDLQAFVDVRFGQEGMSSFVDAPDGSHWDPKTCDQPRLRDWTGLDSVVSPVVGALVMFLWSAIER